MKNIKKLLVLASATLILGGCNDTNSSSNADSSVASSSIENKEWTEAQEYLLTQYCGNVLPYPTAFEGDVSVERVALESGETILQIINASPVFTIGDYYKDLEETGWEGIRDYNGNIAQKDSSDNPYYEFTKLSSDNKTGYHITYYFYTDTASTSQPTYNVIECRNDFDVEVDDKTEWSDEEKETLKGVTTEIPPVLKLGKTNTVGKSNDNFAYCYDMSAINYTLDNVNILKEGGYTLDSQLSKSYSAYVLKKNLGDGATIYASVYYYSGNYITFSYNAKTVESESWPKEFVSDFESKSGFTLPTFEGSGIKKYYGYSKNGVTTIYAYIDDSTVSSAYELKLLQTDAIYDPSRSWYSNWNETFYLQPAVGTDSSGKTIFGITFGLLDEPYDDIQEGWPTSSINEFLVNNKINATFPIDFDFSSLSPYKTCHVQTVNYDYVYANCLNTIKANPENYVDDPTNEEEIEALAASMAKSRTCMKIKMRDPAVINDSETGFKVFEELSNALYKTGWSRISDENHYLAYENETGDVLIAVDIVSGTTVLTITYGSGQTHSPKFQFEQEEVTIAPGKAYNLDYTVDMLPYDITFTSDNEKVTVTNNGCVSVSADAPAGLVANITASMTLPSGETKQITCKVIVSGTYDYETAMQGVVSLYNSYFNLNEGDEGAAKATLVDKSSDDYTFKFYELIVTPTSMATIDEAKQFVTSNLIPAGFKNYYDGIWSSGEREDGTTFESIEYQYYDKDYNGVLLTFVVYTDSTTGSVTIRATTYAN